MKNNIRILLILAIVSSKLLGQPYSSSYDQNNIPISGQDCSAFGIGALLSAANALYANAAVGFNALYSNTHSEKNVAFGAYALYNTGPSFFTQGPHNSALGAYSLYSNTTGTDNNAVGFESNYSNTTGVFNTASGTHALHSNITGNRNTATGYNALYSNPTAGAPDPNDNTATGHSALYSNDDGSDNTADGKNALYNNIHGSKNTGIGFETLYSNSNGNGNTAAGYTALRYDIGDYNTAIGEEALYNNDVGTGNTSIGAQALYYNQGDGNVGIGVNAGRGSFAHSCDLNTAVGINAFQSSTNGSDCNTAIGATSLANKTGDYNTALGYAAGVNDVLAANPKSGDTYLGDYTRITNAGANGNITLIGHFATMANNSQDAVRFGDIFVGTVETGLGGWVTSDGRFKYDVREADIKGLEFITKLRPVTYNFNVKKLAEKMAESLPENMKKDYLNKDCSSLMKIKHSGFLAQEVEQAAKKTGYIFDAIKVPANNDEYYGLSYSLFVVPLIKAIQEQQLMLNESRQKINEISKKINRYKSEGPSIKISALFSEHEIVIGILDETGDTDNINNLRVYDEDGYQLYTSTINAEKQEFAFPCDKNMISVIVCTLKGDEVITTNKYILNK
jgi:hypothetical protein